MHCTKRSSDQLAACRGIAVLVALACAALLLVSPCPTGRAAMSEETATPEWTELFSGKDMTGWHVRGKRQTDEWLAARAVAPKPDDETHFVIEPGEGVMVNGESGRTDDILTDLNHGDCEAHIEFVVPRGSNSGVYFMGHYEIQVFDSWGVEEVKYSDCGGIYCQWIDNKAVGGTPPRVNASKAPGQWQTFDVIFRAPRFDEDGNKVRNAMFVKVVHNGTVVHENVEVGGPTRASLPGPERAEGPLMLQGDHGPVAYRNVRIRPLKP